MVYNPNFDPPPPSGNERILTDAPRGYLTAAQIAALAGGSAAPLNSLTVFGQTILDAVPSVSPVIIQANTAIPATYANNTDLIVIGADGVAVASLMDGYGGTPRFAGRRADGTMAAPTAVQSGETLIEIEGIGYGASGYSGVTTSPKFLIQAAENWTNAAHGSMMTWTVIANGTTTPTQAMRLQNDGVLTIGTTVASGSLKLQVTGGTTTDTLAVTGGVTGTFTANGATPVTVTNANVTANSVILVTLKTVGGTVGAVPAVKTITPTTGFTVAATAADTSVYNYVIIS